MRFRTPHLLATFAFGMLAGMLVVTLYVAGYFVLAHTSEFSLDSRQHLRWRGYTQEWLVEPYKPLGRIESALTGVDVQVRVRGDNFDFEIE